MNKSMGLIIVFIMFFIINTSLAIDEIRVGNHFGPPGSTIDVPIYMENSETAVLNFLFHITYNPLVLVFSGYTSGDLTNNFQIFDMVEDIPGDIIVSGSDTVGISIGSDGIIGHVLFTTNYGASYITPTDLQEDTEFFSVYAGSFTWCAPEWLWLQRDLPTSCEPGVPFVANYSYVGGSAAIIETRETVPDGWSITDPPWDDKQGNTYYWNGPIFSATIVPSTDALPGTYTISGQTVSTHWCNGEVTHPITGDDTLDLNEPTPTPTATVTPTATPTSGPMNIAIELTMPALSFATDDSCWLTLDITNPGALQTVDLYVLLGVYGEYWSYPSWKPFIEGLDCEVVTVGTGSNQQKEILPTFQMPGVSPAGPFYFYGVMFEPQTLAIDTMISNVSVCEFYLE